MIRLRNCSIQEASDKFGTRRIILFGTGMWCTLIQYTGLGDLAKQIAYVVDNRPSSKSFWFRGRNLPVYTPEILSGEKNCVIILSSPVYMYDMYMQLGQMDLDDSVECFAFPFMQLVSTSCPIQKLEVAMLDSGEQARIPRIIHSFWFSGEEKPDSYKRCVDTWHKICPDYEIIEWTKENYDYTKNPFCRQAIELGAWAFASDYARLDVVSRMGGIYMDMDIELLKPLDAFLGNDAFFSFANNVNVDLALFGSAAGLPLINRLLALYDCIPIPESRREFSRFFQPGFVAGAFHDIGLKFDGSSQLIDGMAFLPKNYFMPLDVVLFEMNSMDVRTCAIHWDNYGWNESDVRRKKLEDNRKLWNLIKKTT